MVRTFFAPECICWTLDSFFTCG